MLINIMFWCIEQTAMNYPFGLIDHSTYTLSLIKKITIVSTQYPYIFFTSIVFSLFKITFATSKSKESRRGHHIKVARSWTS